MTHRAGHREYHKPEGTEDDGQTDIEKIVLVLLFAVPAVDQQAEDWINGHIENVAEHHPFGQPGRDEPLDPDGRLDPEDGGLKVDNGLVVPSGKEDELEAEGSAVDVEQDQLDGESAEQKPEMPAGGSLGDGVDTQIQEPRTRDG
jgi:hypothetical protein